MSTGPVITGSLIGGVLAAIGASLCCVAPLVLVTLGVGGAWVTSLAALEPLRPLFLLATTGLFGAAWWKLYPASRRCAPGQACASPLVLRRQRTTFRALALVVAALIAFPWIAPSLY